ncbi:hypothetical protein L2E82_10411 [Cichorium intybus]|uniref:Uncharacterized protein n=1 Tax=Cichorium intybus TaxID=13427 RepID=A0ACB9GBG3_CICIN|nr:hypothetical protein L2E82_10411 [Cichorium intybus]
MAKYSSSAAATTTLAAVLTLLPVAAAPKTHAARAFFVFGDSLVDNGNNNYLLTTTRADAPPYGIDYPTHRPTGRFSNGLNIPDLISQKLGAEPTLPYLSLELNGNKLLVGANFASAGIGIGMILPFPSPAVCQYLHIANTPSVKLLRRNRPLLNVENRIAYCEVSFFLNAKTVET